MRFPPRRSFWLWLLALACALVGLQGAPAQAAPPDETRPYLELPFPQGTAYEVTCGYDCYQHHGSMRYAVDFDIAEGEPIVAAAPGTVMALTWEIGLPANLNLGDALILYLDHGDGWFTRYVHLSGITVRVGETVEMGQVIGYSGKTGASGDHLHFELKYGTSLHSPSVPINELFGGDAPVAGHAYSSNNRALFQSAVPTRPAATATAALPPTEIPSTATPAPSETFQPDAAPAVASLLPEVSVGLDLSEPTIAAGESVTATFTLQNGSRDRLHLAVLGIGSRVPGEEGSDRSLVFDRSIVLNPGRSYRFSRPVQFNEAGEVELFVFALGVHNEWIPLAGDDQTATLQVREAPHTLYLPLIFDPPSGPASPQIDMLR